MTADKAAGGGANPVDGVREAVHSAVDASAAGVARVTAALQRPRLRGWSHLIITVPAAVATVILVVLAGGDPGRQVALLVYGASSVLLFGVSGLYHTITWSPRARSRMRRFDHSNIFLLVAGTYTPLTLTVLDGGWKWAMFGGAWGIAIVGVAVNVASVPLPRSVRVGCYIAQGWLAVVVLPVIAGATGPWVVVGILGAGALYSIGALMYATRRPRLSPRWFSYHEVFHLLVIAANAVFFTLMVTVVVPHAH